MPRALQLIFGIGGHELIEELRLHEMRLEVTLVLRGTPHSCQVDTTAWHPTAVRCKVLLLVVATRARVICPTLHPVTIHPVGHAAHMHTIVMPWVPTAKRLLGLELLHCDTLPVHAARVLRITTTSCCSCSNSTTSATTAAAAATARVAVMHLRL
jgi:hypothetical protein